MTELSDIPSNLMLNNMSKFSELFLKPSFCAVTYSVASNRIIESLAHTPEICSEAAYALMGASSRLHIDRPDVWMSRFRRMRFLDRTDLFLTLLHGDGWLDKWVRVEGAWPQNRPFVAVTFHYGAGFWVFRHMRRSGLNLGGVRGDLNRCDMDSWIRYQYSRLRNWNVDHELGAKALTVGGGAARNLIAQLRDGRCMIGLMDIPHNGMRNNLQTDFLGFNAQFNKGLVSVAKIAQVPLVVYTMRVAENSKERVLSISEPISPTDEYAAGCEIIRHLETAIAIDSTQWHQWGVIGGFRASPSTG